MISLFNIETSIKHDALIEFDAYGNMYLNIDSVYYSFDIDNKNNIIIEEDNSIIEQNTPNIKIHTLELEERDINDDHDERDGDDDGDDSNGDGNGDDNSKDYYNYFPEDKNYREVITLDEDQFDDYESSHLDNTFVFLKSTDINITIRNREDIYSESYYETLIYNGDYKNGNLVFKTKQLGLPVAYRILLFLDGYICFRPIGNKPTYFKMMYNPTNKVIILDKIKDASENTNIETINEEDSSDELESNELTFKV